MFPYKRPKINGKLGLFHPYRVMGPDLQLVFGPTMWACFKFAAIDLYVVQRSSTNFRL